MKKIIVFSAVLALASWTFAQNTPQTAQPAQPAQTSTAASPEQLQLFNGTVIIPKEYSKEDVKNSILDNFEMAEEWSCNIPREQGVALKLKIKKPKSTGADDIYCLGVKCMTYTRGFDWLEVKPPTPIKIPPKTKAIGVLVFGQNLRHHLAAWVRDYHGVDYRIDLGSLNFRGWQTLAAAIPTYVPVYSRYVPQDKPLWLQKLVVEFDPDEEVQPLGTYYYFDNFEAAIDTYNEPWDGSEMYDADGTSIFELQQITWMSNSRK